MAQFIKLPKSTTNAASFDLINIGWGVGQITSPTATKIRVSVYSNNVNSYDTDALSSFDITMNAGMSDSERLDMINNVSLAAQEVCENPNSIPSLRLVGTKYVASLDYLGT
tara:strand:- start:416 stop:748 length:333 start_codon:yes stop_codon:yes gene_type:complete